MTPQKKILFIMAHAYDREREKEWEGERVAAESFKSPEVKKKMKHTVRHTETRARARIINTPHQHD